MVLRLRLRNLVGEQQVCLSGLGGDIWSQSHETLERVADRRRHAELDVLLPPTDDFRAVNWPTLLSSLSITGAELFGYS